MLVETQLISQQILGLDSKPNAAKAVDVLSSMSQLEQWELLRQGLEEGAQASSQNRGVLFFQVDNTVAAGPHAVSVLLNPERKVAVVEAPSQSERFPTVLHSLEVVTTVEQLKHPQAVGADLSELSYPRISFLKEPEFQEEAGRLAPQLTLIPLTIDPENTHAVLLHPQARRLNPWALALGYYNLIQGLDLRTDLMRHTMLVTSRGWYNRPKHKRMALVEVLPKAVAQQLFILMHIGRVQPWSGSDPTEEYELVLQNREVI